MVNLRGYLKSVCALFVMFIWADYAAEIKVWSDSEAEQEEITSYKTN